VFEIKKREVLASVSIVAIMLLIGVLIAGKISTYQMDKNEMYNKAVKIETKEMFQYGMDTNVGNAFVYGDLKAVDTVTYPEIGGEYMYVEKVKEQYTMHTRVVTHSNGKTTYTTTEIYWTWDRVGSEDIKCKEVSFCGVNFASNKIDLPGTDYIDTIKESSHVRYKYYAVGTEYKGTLFTDLREKTISENSKFYNSLTIEKTLAYLESGIALWVFWLFWIVLIGGVVFGFYCLDNKWLD
jgi:arginyl-tRNA synthetase